MNSTAENSDQTLLDLLRRNGSLGVADLAESLEVTATAVRQRLTRLMAEGLVQRELARAGRGRPKHRYSLTTKGLRSSGTNYADLATALWREIRGIREPEVRVGLLQRLVTTLSSGYASQIRGQTLTERMESLQALLGERQIPVEIDQSGQLPVLSSLACPYPDLAEQDRSICAMERLLYSELLGENLRLADCRLDGATCCTFEAG